MPDADFLTTAIEDLVAKKIEAVEALVVRLGGPEALGGPVAAIHFYRPAPGGLVSLDVLVDKDGKGLGRVAIRAKDPFKGVAGWDIESTWGGDG